jgi:hypothetical protein
VPLSQGRKPLDLLVLLIHLSAAAAAADGERQLMKQWVVLIVLHDLCEAANQPSKFLLFLQPGCPVWQCTLSGTGGSFGWGS